AHAWRKRPYTVANFVASVDGRASFAGRSGPLGDDGDKALFTALRAQADAVLVGTNTLATERYGRLIPDPEVRARRRSAGRRPEPILCTATRSGKLPLDIPVFAEPEAEIVVFTGAKVSLGPVAARVDVVRTEAGKLSFTTALAELRAQRDIRALLCEGGPTVLGALVREQALDELFLTVTAKLAGGGAAPAITSGPALPELAPAELAGVLERAGTLFLRYRSQI
ncbi:MAG: dihydrofolate reductase family protein, partial [Actinomycetota bacterium]|nr:dihydrofolate reductase family protein [Actinomycetota bacterium]